MAPYDDAVEKLIEAIENALEACDALSNGANLPEMLSEALTQVATGVGSYRLIMHRPGSWEAQHVADLDMSRLYDDHSLPA